MTAPTTTPIVPPKPRALPRRANGIRRLAADMATRKLTETNARQSVSDRIGYAVSVVVGAVAFHLGGPKIIVGVVALYLVSASVAYSRYLTLKRGR